MQYKEKDILADVVQSNHLLLPVINRFGIKLGILNDTIGEICDKLGLNKNFFLTIINIYNDENFFPEEKLKRFPKELIINYLLKNHDYYKNYLLPDIESDIDKLKQSSKGKKNNVSFVLSFFRKFKQELLNHFRYEESEFFPYVLKNEDLNIKKDSSLDHQKGEHEKVLLGLSDLKSIIIKYLPPTYDINLCNHLLMQLFVFEFDLKAHERLEDHVLLPSVYIKSKGKVQLKSEMNSVNVPLSNREKEVLILLTQGFSNKEIAEKLFISTHTVISHRKNITEKLGIKSASGLTIYAILKKLIDAENIDPEMLV